MGTENEDFYSEGANAKLLDLGEVKLSDIFSPLKAAGTDASASVTSLLPNHRDA